LSNLKYNYRDDDGGDQGGDDRLQLYWPTPGNSLL